MEPGGAELVFIDVSTEPGMALVTTFAAAHPECAVLAVAPAAQPQLGLQAARSGAADFVRYPFEAEELGYVVHKVYQPPNAVQQTRRAQARLAKLDHAVADRR